MFEFRVTKYDPKFRSVEGSYARDDWTSVSDVGKSFEGKVLAREEYDRTENAYLAAAEAFLVEAGVQTVFVRGLEDPDGCFPQYREGAALPPQQIAPLLSLLLREQLWCRLEAPDAFVHIGHDYYMYVGVPRPCLFAQRQATGLGLFVELFRSPYHPE
ncbi:hypothetical protein [Lysobacter sp. A3-1-A15]|uniref:hypothetical protein n=1 Tax=Novilysobacter viscosus TaxID=3098602 RepID=UPI002EDB7CD7